MFIKKWFSSFNQQPNREGEAGQSIVIIAFAMIGLLAFAGIAVDVGFVFARTTQLQAGVDAAVLAGVTELGTGNLNDADNRAAQFLRANGIPISVTQTFLSSRDTSPLMATEYTITATWPVGLFFLRVIGLEEINVTRSATAAYFPLADIYANRRVEYGFVGTANQSLFGPQICTSFGDPFSPFFSNWQPGFYTWRYRIFIPPDYPEDILRIEIFDPDSYNADITGSDEVTVQFSQTAINYGSDDPNRFPPGGTDMECPAAQNQRLRYQPCVIPTGELAILDEDPTISLDQINPYWYVRIDENRGAGDPPDNTFGDFSCSNPPGNNYTSRYNTQTVYALTYFSQSPDGGIVELPLASYTGQVRDGIRDDGGHQTDMRWVSPGAAQPADYPVDPNTGQQVVVPTDNNFGSFEINLATDVPNILEDPATGARYIQLNITTISGASENNFELWAGPRYNLAFASDANTRNIQMTNNPGDHFSEGVLIFAMGNLPMNSIFSQPVDIPLVFLGPELAGQQVFISLFDPDAGTQPPIGFFFDTIAFEAEDQPADDPDDPPLVGVNWDNTDWGFLFGDADDPNDEGRCFHVDNPGGNRCTNQWVNPPYSITIPGDMGRCDYEVLDDLEEGTPEYRQYLMDNCTPFYGGRLNARYASANFDTYSWQIRLEGLPWLVR